METFIIASNSIVGNKKNLSISKLFRLTIYFYVFSIFFSISSGEMLVKLARLLVVGAWFLNLVCYKNKLKANYFYVWTILFLGYHFLLIFSGKTIDTSASSAFFLTTSYTFIVNAIIFSYLIKHRDFFFDLIKIIAIVALFGLLRIYFTYGFNYYFNSRGAEVNGNGPGFKGVFGALCALYIFIQTYEKRTITKEGLLYGILFLMNVLMAILTASRMVFVNLGVPILFYLVFRSKNVIKLIRNIVVVIVLIGIAFYIVFKVPFFYKLVGNRIESMINGFLGEETDSSTSTRMKLAEWGIEFFKKNSILGYGLDGFRSMMKITYPNYTAYYAHNNFVEMLVAGGIIGFVIYYSLYCVVLIKGFKSLKTNDKTIIFFLGIFLGEIISEYGRITYYETVPQLLLMLNYFVINKYSSRKEKQ